jgi:hypothetical protein
LLASSQITNMFDKLALVALHLILSARQIRQAVTVVCEDIRSLAHLIAQLSVVVADDRHEVVEAESLIAGNPAGDLQDLIATMQNSQVKRSLLLALTGYKLPELCDVAFKPGKPGLVGRVLHGFPLRLRTRLD